MTTPATTDFPGPEEIEFAIWDKMHCPRVMSPISEDVFGLGLSAGFTQGMDELACPLGLRYQSVNYYNYAIISPQEAILNGKESMDSRLGRSTTLFPGSGWRWHPARPFPSHSMRQADHRFAP